MVAWPKFALLALVASMAVGVASGEACVAPGVWRDREGQPMPAAEFLDRAAQSVIVLLGERHGTPEHHRWQAEVVKALLDRGRAVVIGLEQLPRDRQAVLDRWVAGELTPEEFRRASGWDELWGHDFEAYRPLLDLGRERRVPMVALNVDRAFVRAVGREGFARAATSGPAPVGRPAPAPPAYRDRLAEVLRAHGREPTAAALDRFVEAQTVWDRAFAEGLMAARARFPGSIAVGVLGLGHVEHGWGTEHQLRVLGETRVVAALPAPAGEACRVVGGSGASFGGG
ncbi:MAG: ChaN family lipoprotein [Sphingomonadaceae bacterium]|uniref:ChaN family lipoprotein n=1 Tax=Thermaurantiacus sp. TaxID=2820283 RepID=UPI00298F03E9|nr:ChaN family lipoprotein [Thermaurantiacus sp.]MCS6986057.1 ChaN family lipoprotein [Sphingomonadaceae bacterium]MDW8414727.1 ChaN family lipoprotein [Thermaurantiacus sp.]